MATTVHPPAGTKHKPTPDRPMDRQAGGNGWRDLVPANGNLRAIEERSPDPSSTGIWVGLAAITMTFAAFTSALVVRQGAAPDWRHFTLPRVLYFNTMVLLASSITLEKSRRRLTATISKREHITDSAYWLYATLGLGLIFVAGQYAAWLRLKSQGLYLATNPSSSFFYLLTAAHALHLVGGLAGLVYVAGKVRRFVLRRSTLNAACYYWHFMDVLWMYLLLLLWVKF
jgi:cytochrome c oxidase subunit III